MLTVPSFILRRLYVNGSLRNSEEGFQFQLCNKLGAGYACRIFPLTVDGQTVPLGSCSFSMDGVAHTFQEVSNDIPLILALNKNTVIVAQGFRLDDGPHKIGMSFEVPGLGVFKFDFTDVVADG